MIGALEEVSAMKNGLVLIKELLGTAYAMVASLYCQLMLTNEAPDSRTPKFKFAIDEIDH